MQPKQQQAYLSAMGIQWWVPKEWSEPVVNPASFNETSAVTVGDALSAVRNSLRPPSPSALLSQSQPAEPLNPQVPVSETRQQAASRPAVQAKLLPSKQAPASVINREPLDADTVPRFTLDIYASKGLIWVNESLATDSASTTEHQRLLKAIFYAMRQTEPSQQSFVWPMVNNSQVPQGPDIARAAVQKLILKQLGTTDGANSGASSLSSVPSSPLLILAAPTLLSLFRLQPAAFVPGIDKLDDWLSMRVLVAPGLQQLLSEPGLKKYLWLAYEVLFAAD